MNKLVYLGICGLLAACGGASTKSGDTSYNDISKRAFDQRALVNDFARTKRSEFPTTGSATFNGYGRIVVGHEYDDIQYNIFGNASVKADFKEGTVTGSVSNLTGRRSADDEVSYHDLRGSVNIGGNSSIGTSYEPERIYVDYDAQISTPDGNILMDGQLRGEFNGNRVGLPEGTPIVRGVKLGDYGGRATLDGVSVRHDVSITGVAVK